MDYNIKQWAVNAYYGQINLYLRCQAVVGKFFLMLTCTIARCLIPKTNALNHRITKRQSEYTNNFYS